MFNITLERSLSTPISGAFTLPFLLASLSSQRFTPTTKNHFRDEYDYIIVGAGSAGSVVASRLSEIPTLKILLLEAGGHPPLLSEVPALASSLFGSYYDWNLKTVPQKHTARQLKNKEISINLGKVLGGSSTLNAMLNVRGNRETYNRWDVNGAKGWKYSDVLPYFKKLEGMRDALYLDSDYHGFSGPITTERSSYDAVIKKAITKAALDMGYHFVDSNGASQYGFFDLTATIRDGRRCSAAKAYLVPADHRENLDIIANALVTKVNIDNKVAVGVEVEFNGTMYTVKAKKEVIISAGAIHTPKILMLSGIGPKDKLERLQIPVIADLPVGLNYHDHVGVALIYEIGAEFLPFETRLNLSQNILQYALTGKGILSSVAGITNEAFLSGDQSQDEMIPDFQLGFREGSWLNSLDDHKKVHSSSRNPLISCNTYTLEPLSRGTIKLKSTDPHDYPVIDPNYFENVEDMRKTVEGLKTCHRIMSNSKLASLKVKYAPHLDDGCKKYEKNDEDEYFKCLARNYASSYFHHAGTAKMGLENDPSTVVNSRLKVKGIKGLRVVDASIMPEVTSGNTNIPVIMIAEKASDMIKTDWFSTNNLISNYMEYIFQLN